MRDAVKVEGKWVKSTDDWMRAQPSGSDIREFLIVQEGKSMGGFVNKTNGARIITFIRKATPEDYERDTTRRFRKKLYINPEDL